MCSYDDLVAEGEGTWDGVRNHLAARNLRSMREGDLVFSTIPTSGARRRGGDDFRSRLTTPPIPSKWAAVKLRPVAKTGPSDHTSEIKATPALAEMDLLRLSRLSVSSVRPTEWALLLDMAGGLVE
jgi:predicted RNA-binding protein with PUA-like domain